MIKQKISKILERIIPNIKTDKHGFYYTVEELVEMYQSTQQAIEWHGSILSNEIINYKTSNSIFILGSGPSINDISEEQWQHIKKHDSIGFNYWFIHNFVPTFYMLQFGNNLLNVLADNHYKYTNIPFIIRGSAFAKKGLEVNNHQINILKDNPVYYLKEYPISSRCSIDINLLFKYMDALGFMEYGTITKFIPKWRSTLGLLLMLAYQMGYKNIVLCGTDMKNSDHFWDYEPYSKLQNKYSLPKIGTSNIKDFTNEYISNNTVTKYIYSLRDWFYINNEVNIFVLSKDTILYPEITLYNQYIKP